VAELERALMPRLGRGNPYVPKTGLGGYVVYYPIPNRSTPKKVLNTPDLLDLHERLSATFRPARAITKAALSATPAVTSQATVYPLIE
jgi:hypothetical protein